MVISLRYHWQAYIVRIIKDCSNLFLGNRCQEDDSLAVEDLFLQVAAQPEHVVPGPDLAGIGHQRQVLVHVYPGVVWSHL